MYPSYTDAVFFDTILNKIATLDVEGIYFEGWGQNAVLFATRRADVGPVRPVLMYGIWATMTEGLLEAVGLAADEILGFRSVEPTDERFIGGNCAAGYVYDATRLLLEKVKEVSTFDEDGNLLIPRKKLAEAIRNTRDFPGVTGPTSFDYQGRGGANKVQVQLVWDGMWVSKKRVGPAGSAATTGAGFVLVEGGQLKYNLSGLTARYEYKPTRCICDKIVFVQVVQHLKKTAAGGWKPIGYPPPAKWTYRSSYMTPDKFYVDFLNGEEDPYYNGDDRLPKSTTNFDGGVQGSCPSKAATMSDTPALPRNQKFEFQTCAFCAVGGHSGLFYGCLNWSWDPVNGPTVSPVKGVVPSEQFMIAFRVWYANHPYTPPHAHRSEALCVDTDGNEFKFRVFNGLPGHEMTNILICLSPTSILPASYVEEIDLPDGWKYYVYHDRGELQDSTWLTLYTDGSNHKPVLTNNWSPWFEVDFEGQPGSVIYTVGYWNGDIHGHSLAVPRRIRFIY